MTKHYVVLSSSYSLGTRICIDIIDEQTLAKSIEKVQKECGEDVSLSMHQIETKNATWESVTDGNTFLQRVKKLDTIDEFIRLINNDRNLCALDITKYIISKVSCTHLKLQKLLYLCYAQYLVNYKKRLFENETICALPRGPIISSIGDRYGAQSCVIEESSTFDADNEEILQGNQDLVLPARSRILFAKDGNEKIHSIDRTLEKYGNMSAGDLVFLTHKPNTPWSIVRERNKHKGGWGEITDDDIITYHKFEVNI